MPNPGIDAGDATAAEYVPPATMQAPQAPTGNLPQSMTTSSEAPQSSITQKSIAPETEKSLNNAAKGLIAAEKAKTEAELQAVKLESDIQQKVAEANLETAKVVQVREQNRQTQIAEANADYSAGVKELSSMKVDPNKIWADKTTGDKILVGVGILLGAFGQGLTGGKSNYALDVIDQAIDRDIAAQKANIGAKQAAVGEKQNAIAMLRQRFGDERLADIAFKDAALDRVKATFIERIASTKSEQVKAAGQKGIAGIDEMQAKLRLDATAINATRTSRVDRVATTVETPKAAGGPNSDSSLEYNNRANVLLSVYDQLEKIPVTERFRPGYLGGQSAAFDTYNATVAATVTELAKLRSDVDFKQIVSKYLVKSTDTKADIKAKKEGLSKMLSGYAPGSSLRQASQKPAVYTPPSYAGAK
jgi:hypothetical protein